jgi:imidazolonepropionase-like amidohydrolase
VRKAVREELRKGANHIKLLVSGGVGSPNDPLESRQFCAEEVKAAVDEATAWNTYVCAHSYTSRSTIHAVEAGVRTIEHGNLIDRTAAELMARKGVFMVPTLVCYDESLRYGKEMGLKPVVMAKLAHANSRGIEMLSICKEAGVKMGFGTDLMGELHVAQSREFSIRREVLPAAEVIAAATIVNAEILNRTGELGVIAPGALADLLVVDGDPLKDINLLQGQGEHLSVIMKGGELYKCRI